MNGTYKQYNLKTGIFDPTFAFHEFNYDYGNPNFTQHRFQVDQSKMGFRSKLNISILIHHFPIIFSIEI